MSLENLVKNHQALLAQGIVRVVSTQPFLIKKTNWSSPEVIIFKIMKVVPRFCSTFVMDRFPGQIPQEKCVALGDSLNATKLYEAFKSIKQIFKRHYQEKKKDTHEVKNYWTETMHFSEKYYNSKPEFN